MSEGFPGGGAFYQDLYGHPAGTVLHLRHERDAGKRCEVWGAVSEHQARGGGSRLRPAESGPDRSEVRRLSGPPVGGRRVCHGGSSADPVRPGMAHEAATEFSMSAFSSVYSERLVVEWYMIGMNVNGSGGNIAQLLYGLRDNAYDKSIFKLVYDGEQYDLSDVSEGTLKGLILNLLINMPMEKTKHCWRSMSQR